MAAGAGVGGGGEWEGGDGRGGGGGCGAGRVAVVIVVAAPVLGPVVLVGRPVVGNEVPQCEAVVTGDEIDAVIRMATRMLIEIATSR